MSNTHFRRILLLLLILAMVTPLAVTRVGFAQEESAIVIGVTDFPTSLDPADSSDYPSWELLTHLYTGLTQQIPGTLDYELALAADHTVSDDGLVHTFTVHAEAAFDDGTPITAATFADSINRTLAFDRDSAGLIRQYIADVTEGDNNTITFTLHSPIPDFEALVALPLFFPLHPAIYPADDILSDEDIEQFISNGVYQLESIRPFQEIVLVANPNYNGPAPETDQIVIRRYALPIGLRRALIAHEVDIAWRALALPDQEALSEETDITLAQQGNLQAFYLLYNHRSGGCSLGTNTRAVPFDDPAVRQGFALLMDRERGAERGFDNAVLPLYSILPPQFSASEDTFPTFDLEQAETILYDAGYRRLSNTVNVPLSISTSNYGDKMNDAAQALQRRIQESEIANIMGIRDNQDTRSFMRAINRGEYCSPIIGWRPLFASPAGYLIPLTQSESTISSNHHYANEDVDALLETVALTTAPDERDEIYRQIQTLLTEDYALIPLWQGQDVIAYWNDISGVTVEANSWLRYDLLSR